MQAAGVPRRIAELAVFDLEHRLGIAAGQNAHFVVEERATKDFQMPLFETDSGTVAIRDADTAKLDVLDQHVGVAHHPHRLAFRAVTVGDEHRSPADSPDRQSVL